MQASEAGLLRNPADIWFHRYEHGRDIEGKCKDHQPVACYKLNILIILICCLAVDYNSWQESDQGLRLAASLDKDVVLAEGIL